MEQTLPAAMYAGMSSTSVQYVPDLQQAAGLPEKGQACSSPQA